MLERLEIIYNRYKEVEEELSSPEVLNDYSKMTKLSKEKSDLEETVEKYEEYKKLTTEIEELKELINDPDMGEMASLELEEKQERLPILTHEIEILLIPKDENDGKDIIMEIRGAAGGDEANIFAGDLYRMYTRYAEKQGWKTEVLNAAEGTSGGYSQIEFSIKGESVYSKLKFESGSHRVQRVPTTESQGRIQTSTATVAVMPEAEDIDFELDMNEIRIDITRSSGCGGQGVNTTDSAVRLTHIPTGIIVYSQTERSQIKNKEIALGILKNKLKSIEVEKRNKEINSLKGSANIDFGSQIRNYVLEPYSLVKDVRSGYENSNYKNVLDGDIYPFIESVLRMKR